MTHAQIKLQGQMDVNWHDSCRDSRESQSWSHPARQEFFCALQLIVFGKSNSSSSQSQPASPPFLSAPRRRVCASPFAKPRASVARASSPTPAPATRGSAAPRAPRSAARTETGAPTAPTRVRVSRTATASPTPASAFACPAGRASTAPKGTVFEVKSS